jgi:hypothetical protein
MWACELCRLEAADHLLTYRSRAKNASEAMWAIELCHLEARLEEKMATDEEVGDVDFPTTVLHATVNGQVLPELSRQGWLQWW